MIANRDSTEPATSRRADPSHPGSPPPRSLAAMVPAEAVVLWLGATAPPLREFKTRGCRVVAFPPEAQQELDRQDLGRGRFDAALAPDVLGRVRHPEALLDSLRASLKSGGRLIVTVPNAGHGAVRAALERGLDPYEGTPLDRGTLGLFARESLAKLLEDAGFAVARLSAIDEPGDAAGSPEARASAWLAVAYPLPIAGLERLQTQFREASQRRDDAEAEARECRSLLEATRAALDAAHRRAEWLAEATREARAALHDAHAQLLERDEAFRESTRDLLMRLDETEHLRRERDAAHRHALAAEGRCRSLELRAEHVVMELPRRVLRKLRKIVRGS